MSKTEQLPVPADLVGKTRDTVDLAAPLGETYRDWYAKVLPSAGRSYRKLALFAVFFLGSFSAWAVVAPIGGATVVPGRVIAEGYNRMINHREGGVIASIEVKEGDLVKAGAVLARIDTSEATTNLEIQRTRLNTADIRLARYRAEQAGESDFTLSTELVKQIRSNPPLAAALESQKSELKTRQDEKRSTLQIFEQRIETERQTLSDLEGLIDDRRQRIADVKEEIRVSDDLLDKGYTTRDRNYNLKRQLSVDQEQLETLMTQIAERRSRHAQFQEDRLRWLAQRSSEISGQLVALNAERAEAIERIRYYEDLIARSVIRAPEAGHIVRSHVNTVGSSVSAGSPIFELLPEQTSPVVEARVTSRDIDIMEVGGEMEIRIASQDRNRSLMFLTGEVTYVSYDAIPVGEPPRSLYVVRGKIDAESIEKYGQVKPGTNVDVYFVTEPKNFVHYVLDPFLGIRDKAFTH